MNSVTKWNPIAQIISIVTVVGIISGASYALSSRIGTLEATVQYNTSTINELVKFKDRGDRFTKSDGIWLKEIITEMKESIAILQTDVRDLTISIGLLKKNKDK